MGIRRIIESTIGHRIAIELEDGGSRMSIAREDLPRVEAVTLDGRAARILSAYLSSTLIVDRGDCEPERIGDIEISTRREPAPIVRVVQGRRVLDIHAPSWETLHCEIDLVTPRLAQPEPS